MGYSHESWNSFPIDANVSLCYSIALIIIRWYGRRFSSWHGPEWKSELFPSSWDDDLLFPSSWDDGSWRDDDLLFPWDDGLSLAGGVSSSPSVNELVPGGGCPKESRKWPARCDELPSGIAEVAS